MEQMSAASKISKMRWTSEEDQLLVQTVELHGTGDWSAVARALPQRNGKQCRERWINQLNPALKLEVWTAEEDHALLRLVSVQGHQWAKIAPFLHGRSVTSTKNRFSYLMRHFTREMALFHASPASRFAPVPMSVTVSSFVPSEPQVDVQRPKIRLPPISMITLGLKPKFDPEFWR
jgi:hypothetical protein